MTTPTEKAEKLSRQRALAAPILGIALMVLHQGVFFNWEGETINYFATAAWALIAIACLTIIFTGGSWFIPKAVRALTDDEVTRENWSYAIQSGFGVGMAICILVFVLEPFFPLTAQRAAHLIFSSGVGVTLVVFGSREQKSLA